MLHLEPVDSAGQADAFADRVIFQTTGWLNFIAASQKAEVVFAAVKDGQTTVGYFTGLVVERYGFRVLGSPMPGWTTSFMGFNLEPGVSRLAAHEALFPYAYKVLKCSHVEVRDRWVTGSDLAGTGWTWSEATTHLIDLHPDEDKLFGNMTSACRRAVRKAEKSGVTIEIATDPGFADEYYDQLRDVFAKQNLVPTYPVGRVRDLIEHVLPEGNLLLLRARDTEGRCIASSVLPWYRGTMYFWGGASYRPDQHLRPNEALIWHAMRWAKEHGVTEFDFVGRGDYKAKYGTYEFTVPWIRRSRSPLVAGLRNAAREGFALRQRLQGKLIPSRTPTPTSSPS